MGGEWWGGMDLAPPGTPTSLETSKKPGLTGGIRKLFFFFCFLLMLSSSIHLSTHRPSKKRQEKEKPRKSQGNSGGSPSHSLAFSGFNLFHAA